jgi:hypothetical protein
MRQAATQEIPELEARAIAGARHMRYLKRLCALPAPHPGKRSNWLKFCSVCGREISTSARGVRTCGDCVPDKQLQRQIEQSLGRVRRYRSKGVKSDGI